MTTFRKDKWMVAWNPTYWPGTDSKGNPVVLGAIEVGPWPDRTGWSRAYTSTAGCCIFFVDWEEASQEQLMEELIRGFFYLVLSEGIDPQAVHREFSKIEGYLDYAGNIGVGMGSYVFFQDGRLSPYNP